MVTRTTARNLGLAILDQADKEAIDWRSEGNRFVIDLDDFNVRVSRSDEAEPQPDVLFEVMAPTGKQIFAVQVKEGDADYNDFRKLLQCAEAYDSTWDSRIRAVTDAMRTNSFFRGHRISGGIPLFVEPPPLPNRPSNEQAAAFFSKIAGVWRLQFEKPNGSQGVEVAEIDDKGNYFTRTDRQGAPKPKEPTPRFRLLLLQADDKLEQVEISKQELNGRHRQLEVLRLEPPNAPQTMRGYAKHDEHDLIYTKQA